ncbi:MAG: hypothetical protein JJT89_07015 [Nitriliruptoraceae bacterium]|nr:hypothetical protein [Nitriliruptoraceae bacterium]
MDRAEPGHEPDGPRPDDPSTDAVPGRYPTAPSWLREVPLAHRGLHGAGIPENSLAAFEAAATAGYGVELDVFLSADGVPVVLHDPSLQRVAGLDRQVGQLTAAELAEVRLGGSDQHVPTLQEALATLRAVPVMVELKQGRLRAGALESATAALLDTHDGPWCVASFNPVAVRWFRRNRPQAVRVLTATAEPIDGVPAVVGRRLARLADLRSVHPHAVSYHLDSIPHPATDAWRARGGVLVTWTAVGEDGIRRGRERADNVIFEHAEP